MSDLDRYEKNTVARVKASLFGNSHSGFDDSPFVQDQMNSNQPGSAVASYLLAGMWVQMIPTDSPQTGSKCKLRLDLRISL